MSMRVKNHPVLGDIKKRNEITVFFKDQALKVYEGETIAAALMAEGIKTLRNHEVSGSARGIYCNIGHCFECRVKINNEKVVRACLTPVIDQMVIHSLSVLEDDEN